MIFNKWNMVFVSMFLLITGCVIIFIPHGLNMANIHIALKFTARYAMVLFFIAWTARSLHILFEGAISKWLIQNRRYIGVSFASAMALHGCIIITKMVCYPNEAQKIIANPFNKTGAIIFLFIFLMAMTSTQKHKTLLGNKWRALHWIGGYVIFITFLFSEYYRIYVSTGYDHNKPYLYFILLMFSLKVISWLKIKLNI